MSGESVTPENNHFAELTDMHNLIKTLRTENELLVNDLNILRQTIADHYKEVFEQ